MTSPSPATRRRPWLPVAILAGVVVAFLGGAFVRAGHDALIAGNEAAAVAALRAAVEAEARWKAGDADGNALPDYWTGDWSGLFRVAAPGGTDPAGQLSPEFAAADAAPLPPTEGPRPRLLALLDPAASRGYRFRALRNLDGRPLAADGPDADANAWENPRAFGFLAFPDAPGRTGRRMFVVREDGVVWAKAAPPGGPAVEDWPSGRMEDAGWEPVGP